MKKGHLLHRLKNKIEIKNGKYHYHYLIYKFTRRSQKVSLIDCGNRFNPFLISNAAKFEKINAEKLLEKIKIIRVFNIFQLKKAVEKAIKENPDVLIVSDIETLLKDQSIPDKERENSFTSALAFINRIDIPVFVVGENFMITNISMDN